MGDLRTKKAARRYRKLIAEGFLENGCRLCKEDKLIKEFKYWRIVKARFPWDRVAKTHHILIPKRHTVWGKSTKIEEKEFDLIKLGYIEKKYELLAEATNKSKTIPTHFHLHLIVVKN